MSGYRLNETSLEQEHIYKGMDISSQLTFTDNPTTYHGVLEHFQAKHPDLLCVFRRKRGFFKKLWEKSTVSKSEFFAPVPVLVLSVKKD